MRSWFSIYYVPPSASTSATIVHVRREMPCRALLPQRLSPNRKRRAVKCASVPRFWKGYRLFNWNPGKEESSPLHQQRRRNWRSHREEKVESGNKTISTQLIIFHIYGHEGWFYGLGSWGLKTLSTFLNVWVAHPWYSSVADLFTLSLECNQVFNLSPLNITQSITHLEMNMPIHAGR